MAAIQMGRSRHTGTAVISTAQARTTYRHDESVGTGSAKRIHTRHYYNGHCEIMRDRGRNTQFRTRAVVGGKAPWR